MAGVERIAGARQAAMEVYRRTLERAATDSVQAALRGDEMFVDSGFLSLERGGQLPAGAHPDPDGFAVITERATIYHDRYGTQRIEHARVTGVRRIWLPSPMSVKVVVVAGGKRLRFAAPHTFSKDWTALINTYGGKRNAAPSPESVQSGKSRVLLMARGSATAGQPNTRREAGPGIGYFLSGGSFVFVTMRRVEWEIGSDALKQFSIGTVNGRLGLTMPLFVGSELAQISLSPPTGQLGAWVRVWKSNGMQEVR